MYCKSNGELCQNSNLPLHIFQSTGVNAGEKHKAEKRRSSSEDDDPDGEGGEGGAEGAHNKKKIIVWNSPKSSPNILS